MKTLKLLFVISLLAVTADYSYAQVNDSDDKGTFTDKRDDHVYNWIRIDDQVWMAGNLAYLPSVNPPSDMSETEPYYYVFDYQGTDVAEAKATDNYNTYGVLYNWTAAMNACPDGWHVPSEEEWQTLITHVGGNRAGGSLKEEGTTHWESPNEGATGTTGFNALPGGFRASNGSFDDFGYHGYWWSATDNVPGFAINYKLDYDSNLIILGGSRIVLGYSVRCVKDV